MSDDDIPSLAKVIRQRLDNNEHERICVVCGEPLDGLDSYDEPCYDCVPEWAEARLEDAERELKSVHAEIARLTIVAESFAAIAELNKACLAVDDPDERSAIRLMWITANGKPHWPSKDEWEWES